MSVSGIVKGLLQKYLGKYIKGLGSNDLALSWSTTELKNLELQESLFDDMGLPMVLHKGFVGNLKLVIPWAQLATLSSKTKIVIELNDIFAVAVAKADVKYDAEEERKKARAAKDKLVQAFEDQRKKAMKEAEEAAKTGDQKAGFVSNLIRTLLENLQVTVTRVHFCLIDNSSVPTRSFVLGLYLEELKLLSVKPEDSDAHIQDSSSLSFMKRASLKGLALYINVTEKGADKRIPPKRDPLLTASEAGIKQMLIDRMDPSRSNCAYVLRPTGFDMALVFNSKGTVKIPQVQVNLKLSVLALELAKAQYSCIMGLLDTMSHYQLYARYRSFKPAALKVARPKGTHRCMLWWTYACNCVRSDLQLKAKRRSWTRVLMLMKAKKRYINLFFDALTSPKNKALKEAIRKMELTLEANEIIHFRKVAYTKWEASPHAARAKQSYAQKALGAVKSWIPSFGFGTSKTEETTAEADEDWDKAVETIKQSTVTADYQLKHAKDMALQLVLKLPRIAVSLLDAGPERHPIVTLAIEGLDFELIQRQKFLALRLYVCTSLANILQLSATVSSELFQNFYLLCLNAYVQHIHESAS